MSNELFSLQGRVYSAIRNPATGRPGALTALGNVSKAEATLTPTISDKYDSRSGLRLLIGRLMKERKGELNMVMDEFTLENLALGLFGAKVPVAHGVATAEVFPAGLVVGDSVALAKQVPVALAGAAGTGTLYVVNNVAGYNVGATSIAVDIGSGTIVAGDIIAIAGDPNLYTVATGVTAPGIITLVNPGLLQAHADEDAITIISARLPVIVDSTGSPVTLVAGTDYKLTGSVVTILNVTGFVQPFKATYTYGSQEIITMMTSVTPPERYIVFDGLDTFTGVAVHAELFRVQFLPAKTFSLIDPDWGGFDLTGALLYDELNAADSTFGGFGRLIKGSQY